MQAPVRKRETGRPASRASRRMSVSSAGRAKVTMRRRVNARMVRITDGISWAARGEEEFYALIAPRLWKSRMRREARLAPRWGGPLARYRAVIGAHFLRHDAARGSSLFLKSRRVEDIF